MLSLNLPQILSCPKPSTAGAAGAQKEGLPCPKGRPQIGRDHAKIVSPVQRYGWPKPSILAGIYVGSGPIPGLARYLRAGAAAALEIRWNRTPISRELI